jgi:hypothetical protein
MNVRVARFFLVGMYMIPKPEKCTKRTQDVPNDHELSQMPIKYSKGQYVK